MSWCLVGSEMCIRDRTYVGRVPAGRIDYIFHSPVLAAQHFVIQEHAFSDHLAVYCEIWKRKITTP
jgi:endonuclease/exonuclease/phosphatase family metal-dependent hydrolase